MNYREVTGKKIPAAAAAYQKSYWSR